MSERKTIVFELDGEEAAAVSNALNYFSNAITAGECSTLAGLEQERMALLHKRLLRLLEHKS